MNVSFLAVLSSDLDKWRSSNPMSEPMEMELPYEEITTAMNNENLPPPPPTEVFKNADFTLQPNVRSPLREISNTAQFVPQTLTADKQNAVDNSISEVNVIDKSLASSRPNISGQDILQSRIDQLERDKVDLTLQLHIREEKDR